MLTKEQVQDAFREAMARSLEEPFEPEEEELDLEDLYAAIMALQEGLRYQLQAHELAIETPYRLVKALAATYELEEFLANEIARAVEAGDLE